MRLPSPLSAVPVDQSWDSPETKLPVKVEVTEVVRLRGFHPYRSLVHAVLEALTATATATIAVVASSAAVKKTRDNVSLALKSETDVDRLQSLPVPDDERTQSSRRLRHPHAACRRRRQSRLHSSWQCLHRRQQSYRCGTCRNE